MIKSDFGYLEVETFSFLKLIAPNWARNVFWSIIDSISRERWADVSRTSMYATDIGDELSW